MQLTPYERELPQAFLTLSLATVYIAGACACSETLRNNCSSCNRIPRALSYRQMPLLNTSSDGEWSMHVYADMLDLLL